MEITQEIVDKLHKYTKIAAADRMGGGSRAALFIAEEATSTALERLVLKPPQEKIRDMDSFLFIIARNTVLNMIVRQTETKKREYFLEKHQVDMGYNEEGHDFEIEDVSASNFKHYQEIKDREKDIDDRIQLIIDTILENEWLDKRDEVIFIERFLNGKKVGEVKDILGVSYSDVVKRSKKIRNVLNYLESEESDVFKSREEEQKVLNKLKKYKK